MTKAELILMLTRRQTQLSFDDVELSVNAILGHITNALSNNTRIEIRGFGVFAIRHRPPRVGRNPKTGEPVSLPAKFVPHFKPGKELRERVNGKYSSPPETF
jgi:integration host factor subunit beta